MTQFAPRRSPVSLVRSTEAKAVTAATLWLDSQMVDWPAMKSNAEHLRALMAKHGMSQVGTAGLLEVAPQTLRSWLVSENARSYRPMPNNMLRLLRLELGEATPRGPSPKKATRRRRGT